jgi:hypothetical protein
VDQSRIEGGEASSQVGCVRAFNLKDGNFMFSTSIEDRKAWHVPIIAPKNRSFTWRIVWLALAISASGLIVHMYRSISNDSALLKILSDSLKTFF